AGASGGNGRALFRLFAEAAARCHGGLKRQLRRETNLNLFHARKHARLVVDDVERSVYAQVDPVRLADKRDGIREFTNGNFAARLKRGHQTAATPGRSSAAAKTSSPMAMSFPNASSGRESGYASTKRSNASWMILPRSAAAMSASSGSSTGSFRIRRA